MFNILWIEDEAQPVRDLGPILARIPGISLTVLLFDKSSAFNDAGFPVIVVPPDGLTVATAWDHLERTVRRYHPWLVLTDLLLGPVEGDPGVYRVGDYKAGGINLTLQLFKYGYCRNVIWLSNYGDNVLGDLKSLVLSYWLEGQVKIVYFPRTFVVEKTDYDIHVPRLIEHMTTQAVKRLLDSKAIYRIEGSQIRRVFQKLLSSASVAHFFTTPAGLSVIQPEALEEAKKDLGSFDLIPDNDPPMSFATWLAAWNPDGPLLDSLLPANARQFADHLGKVLARSLWGMTVQELPELVHYAAQEHNVNLHLLNLEKIELIGSELSEEIVIGPIARKLMVSALGNSLENAQRYGNGSKLFLRTLITSNAIYLAVANEVANTSETVRLAIQKGKNNQLRGVYYTRCAIDELNELHEHQRSNEPKLDSWGSWGFATFGWDNQGEKVKSFKSEAFTAGSLRQREANFDQRALDIFLNLGRQWGKSGVMCVFRLPLVRMGDLAQRIPSPEPPDLALRMTP